MIIEKHGDIFNSEQPALGQGVNCQGMMGSGIAVLFKREFPEMYKDYKVECKTNKLQGGGLHTYFDQDKNKWIFNIASQYYPGASATHDFLSSGVEEAFLFARRNKIKGFAIPQIGHGIGKLDWDKSILIIESLAAKYPEIDLEIWYYSA